MNCDSFWVKVNICDNEEDKNVIIIVYIFNFFVFNFRKKDLRLNYKFCYIINYDYYIYSVW